MFKTINHYPNYEVHFDGRVRNKTTGHVMKWINNGKGYFTVKLYNQETPKGRLCLVHRLVLSTHDLWIPDGNLDVNHIDGDKSNNHIHTVDTKVDKVQEIIASMGKEITKLGTIIEERIPKK